jgi:hypothetical protein
MVACTLHLNIPPTCIRAFSNWIFLQLWGSLHQNLTLLKEYFLPWKDEINTNIMLEASTALTMVFFVMCKRLPYSKAAIDIA